MNIVVLTLHDLRDYPLADWLDGEEYRLFVLADAETQKATPSDFPRLGQVEFFDNYINNGLVDKRVLEIFATHGINRLVTFGEDDVIRAARLRALLRLPGQDVAGATAFRCKVTMKEALRAVDVPLPAFARLASPVDLIHFAEKHGFPLFVKPTTSSGSTWGTKLADAADLDDCLATRFKARVPFSEYVSDLMVESYVEGALHHVDGFWDGHSLPLAVASRYLSRSLELGAMEEDIALMSSRLPDDSELSHRLVAETRKVLSALPSGSAFPFHAEFFVEDGRITFCEIACRTGGARVASTVEAATGRNLNRLSFLSQLGKPVDARAQSSRAAGWSLLCPSNTTVVKTPTPCPFEWVSEYKSDAKVGDRTDHRHYSGHKIASAVVVGRDSDEVAARLKEFNRWFLDSFTVRGGHPND